MGAYDASQFTNKAIALMNKAVLNEGLKIQFTKIVTSDVFPDGEDYKEMTEIPSIKQTLEISKIVVQDERTIKISGVVSNEELTSGYYVRTVGLYANDPDEGEILYSVTKAETADWMPPNDSISSTSLLFNLYTAVHNSENIILTIGSGTTATVQDINIINNYIENDLEPRIEALEEVAPNIAVNAANINKLKKYVLLDIPYCGIERDILKNQQIFNWIHYKTIDLSSFMQNWFSTDLIATLTRQLHKTFLIQTPLIGYSRNSPISVVMDDSGFTHVYDFSANFKISNNYLTNPNGFSDIQFIPRLNILFGFLKQSNGSYAYFNLLTNEFVATTVLALEKFPTTFAQLPNGNLLVTMDPAFNPGQLGIVEFKNSYGISRELINDSWQSQLPQIQIEYKDGPLTNEPDLNLGYKVGTLLPSGDVLLIPITTANSLCIYKFATNTVEHINLPVSMQGYDFSKSHCVLLPEDNVLIVPSSSNSNFVIYNYLTDTFKDMPNQPLDPDPNNRWYASLLPNGSVLAVSKGVIKCLNPTFKIGNPWSPNLFDQSNQPYLAQFKTFIPQKPCILLPQGATAPGIIIHYPQLTKTLRLSHDLFDQIFSSANSLTLSYKF